MRKGKTKVSKKPRTQESDTPFQRFRRLVGRVVSVPKDRTNKVGRERTQQTDTNN